MRLVFVTRKVDRGDALTGFVFTWLAKLSAGFEKLYVICQEKGDTSGLPSNVEVHSFGKERGFGKLRQAVTLFALSFSLVRKTNGFFIHMHPIYAILAWLPAKIHGKKLVFWYTHKAVDLKLRLAHTLVDQVLTASRESFRLPSKKVQVVGHGIDLSKFKNQNEKGKITNQNSKFRIISIGRISPIKDYETLIKAIEILVNHQGVEDLEVEIYGKIGLPEHQAYLDSLVWFVHNADLEDLVKFQGELNYEYVQEAYREADLFVNLSGTGSIDKTVLEAAACGTLVLTSNEAFQGPLQRIAADLTFERNNAEDLAQKILRLKALSDSQVQKIKTQLQKWVTAEHNLDNLVKKIKQEFSP